MRFTSFVIASKGARRKSNGKTKESAINTGWVSIWITNFWRNCADKTINHRYLVAWYRVLTFEQNYDQVIHITISGFCPFSIDFFLFRCSHGGKKHDRRIAFKWIEDFISMENVAVVTYFISRIMEWFWCCGDGQCVRGWAQFPGPVWFKQKCIILYGYRQRRNSLCFNTVWILNHRHNGNR